jgi:hypothetical protein
MTINIVLNWFEELKKRVLGSVEYFTSMDRAFLDLLDRVGYM